MAFTLHAFYRSVAKSGYTVVTPVADTKDCTVTGTNYLQFPGERVVCYVHNLSAGVANAVRARLHHTADPNWMSHSIFEDQTGGRNHGYHPRYTVPNGTTITAEADNGNNNQLEVILVGVGEQPFTIKQYPNDVQAGAVAVRGVGTATLVAGAFTAVPITWDYNFIKGRKYRLIGLSAHSATAYAVRMAFKEAALAGHAPGVPAGDTNVLAPTFYFDGPSFDGGTPPDVEMLASAGDTAEAVTMIVVPEG